MTQQNRKSILVDKATKREFDLLKADLQVSQDELIMLLIKNYKKDGNK